MSDIAPVPVAPNDKWKPIDTAPKDGSVITVGLADGATWIVSTGVWELPKARWFTWCNGQPTHWLPAELKPPPKPTPEQVAAQVDVLRMRNAFTKLLYKHATQAPDRGFLHSLELNPGDLAFPDRWQAWSKVVDDEFPLLLKEMP